MDTKKGPKKLHSRQITIESFHLGGDRLLVVGRLEDDLHQSYPNLEGALVPEGKLHDLTIEIEVRPSDLRITGARAEMARAPSGDCREVVPLAEQLVGLSVGDGFASGLRERLGGARWCVHLSSLMMAMAPAVLQGTAALSAQIPLETRIAFALSQLVNSCLVWREGGPFHRMVEAAIEAAKARSRAASRQTLL